MENESRINCVPSFARGLNLLLVHDDESALVYLSSLLEHYSFKVTATYDMSSAASMICAQEGRFKLIMAKANMPDMDAVSFLEVVLEKDIPVIFISSRGYDDVTQKALATGLCYVLKEPIHSSDLKNIWQHVYRSKAYSYSTKETPNVDFQNQGMVCNVKGLHHTNIKQGLRADGERSHDDDKGGKLKEKRTFDCHTMPGSWITTQTQCHVHRANGKGNHDDNGGMLKEKGIVDDHTISYSWSSALLNFFDNYYNNAVAEKQRSFVWTPKLHLKFVQAIRVLGENNARPRQILNWMNEPYLTVRQVASHLQKYKLRLKRIENARNSDSPRMSSSSSLSRNAQFPLPSEVFSLGTKGLSASIASLNESQKQNQFFPELLETPGNSTAELINCGSQSQDSSMYQNQTAAQYHDLTKKLLEDSDNFDYFENETDPGDVDQYCEMLKKVLDGNN